MKPPATPHTAPARRFDLLLPAAFLFALPLLLIGSKSSPLYPMNDNVDINVLLTVGRGILDGKVPYRDLFEQKGPVTYFVLALQAVFFRQSYFGVFLLELVSFALFLYNAGRIIRLYTKTCLPAALAMLLLGTGVAGSPAMANSGTPEQFFLFPLTLSAFYMLRAVREDRPLLFREAFTIGFLAAAAFWTKYTFCGFFAAIALFTLIRHAAEGRFKAILLSAWQMLFGFSVLTLPVLLYFAATGSLGDLYTVYFVRNITEYARTEKSIWEYVRSGLSLTYKRNRWFYGWLIWPGLLFVLIGFFRRWKESLLVLLCYAGLALTTYMSSPGYIYYGLILAPFAVTGLAALAFFAEWLVTDALRQRGETLTAFRPSPGAVALLLAGGLLLTGVSSFLVYKNSQNTYLLAYEKEDLPQYQFAETIRETPGATLLNYGFLDGGFYMAAGIEPVNRYFCYFNIAGDEMWADQRALLTAGGVDYVVTRNNPLPSRYVRYELIRTATFFYGSKDYVYFLYRLAR